MVLPSLGGVVVLSWAESGDGFVVEPPGRLGRLRRIVDSGIWEALGSTNGWRRVLEE